MSDDVMPNRCACGGQAQIFSTFGPFGSLDGRTKRVVCLACYLASPSFPSKVPAITAWNEGKARR